MSQRNSGYDRIAGDTYVTPRWVYEVLYTVEPWAAKAYDCAPIRPDFDFLTDEILASDLATNPPFGLADEFCRRAIKKYCRTAMLLPLQFDAAKSRRDLFADNSTFKAKYTLTKRIRWENLEQKKAGPSTNHSWFVWDNTHRGAPIMGWL